MERKILTFVPAANKTYVGFDGGDCIALIVAYHPDGQYWPTTWQWCAYSSRTPNESYKWQFPEDAGRSQREPDAEKAIRRAAQYIGHGHCRPVSFCPADCPDCPSIEILDEQQPPEEVDK